MEIRELSGIELRAEQREVIGIAVPYDQVAEVRAGGYKERFEFGSIADHSEGPVYYRHDHQDNGLAIGYIKESTSDSKGLKVVAKIHKNAKGDKVLSDIAAGRIKGFSVGFVPLEHRDEDGVLVRTKIDLQEISLAELPVYAGAALLEVRENNKKVDDEEDMSEINDKLSSDVTELRETVSELDRKMSVLETRESNDSSAVKEYRSGGDFLKALATGADEAKIQVRAFTGATTVDADAIRPAWVNQTLKLVEKQRIVKNLFASAPLPGTGNSIEYPYVKTETGAVGVQSAEGADLPYLELVIDTATAPVVTHGGYSSLSRQAIERSDVAYLESVLRFQAISYGNSTESAVQAALAGAAGVNSVELAGATNSAKTAAMYLEAVIDAKAAIDDNSKGLQADVILVSRDVHKKLSLLVDTTGRPLFVLNGDGVNSFGSIPAGRLAGVIDNTPLVVGKNLAAGTIVVASAQALTSYESPGAPVALQDENIINLTKDFSLYGYFAVAVNDAKGITKIVDAS
ncbi:phage major capsid protein [Rhodococcus sp. IEGM 1381]|uniref:phage major capsid protein n=1 Tax=Rhodococcus sp. IEGM 1381 TaxID=3047085 RepID=UPI0024B7E960|nr:phage major capsid protein [Rhodococcus sp. IEGM 1381]MDI9895088.1 phage major capsid protein [Rhodococcus sp. IEGM 1381]